jgi:hypothetical protein
MLAHKTRSTKLLSALAITQLLFACGGGGGTDTPVAVDPKTKETALEIRLASTLIEVNSMGTRYFRGRLDQAYVTNFWKPKTLANNGCHQFGVTNPDNSPSVGDSSVHNHTNCVTTYKQDTNASTYSNTEQSELVTISEPSFPSNASWTYVDKQTTTNQITFRLNLDDKINFNGVRTDKGEQVQKSSGSADGSQVDSTTYAATSRETSDFGQTDVSISGNISCQYASGVFVNGDCTASTATLTGTIYGNSIKASMRQLTGLPETHEISYGDKKITIIVKTDANNPYRNQLTVKTSTGESFALTGEETSRLRFY